MKQFQEILLYGLRFIQVATFNKDFRLAPEMNNDACLAYVKAGKYEVFTPSERLIAKNNESILMKCGNYVVDLEQDTEENYFKNILFHLDPESIKRAFENKDLSFLKNDVAQKKKHAAVKIDRSELLDSFVESIMPYLKNPDLISENLMEVKLQELVYILCASGDRTSISYILGTLFEQERIEFDSVIEANLFNNLSIAELAHLAIRSESSFKRDFKKAYGMSPAKYIKHRRLEKAEELLRTTKKPIRDIAWDCGFDNAAHFSNSFRLEYGCSPRAYRI